MANSYTLNSYQVYFASVLTIHDAELVSMFKSLETSGIRTFLDTSTIIYNTPLVDFYARALISKDGNVTYSQGEKKLVIDEDFLSSTFSLPMAGITDFPPYPRRTWLLL